MPDSDPAALRRRLIDLKAATLRAHAIRMGLTPADGDISAAATAKIERDVAALPDAELPAQIAHWTALHEKAAPSATPPPHA